jgi:hypothetical protein
MPAPKRLAATLLVAAAAAGAAPAVAGAAAPPIPTPGTALPTCVNGTLVPNGPVHGQPDPIGIVVPYRPYACLVRSGPMDGGPIMYPLVPARAVVS